jgi:energy-coupling factor transporter ATP-binding protein EcfA2
MHPKVTSPGNGDSGALSISPKTPSITFESLTFSDGTVITLESKEMVLFVGPNNAGKSAALRDIEAHIGPQFEGTVIKTAKRRRVGTIDELREIVETHTRIAGPPQTPTYAGAGISLYVTNLGHHWDNDLTPLRPLFCQRIATETRITESNPQTAINIVDQPPSHPIHMLFADSSLEGRISGYFRQAFGEELFLCRESGAPWSLRVGDRPGLQDGENPFTPSYLKRVVSSTDPLQMQGDGMRSFATVILRMLAPDTPSLLLLDEPEAFLHPPQARLLGEFIAKEWQLTQSQLFVATHSPEVLQGMLSAAPESLRVIRIQRDGSINRVKELDKSQARELTTDPVMRFTSVLSGVFHKRVIICESDPDCMFYSAILDIPEVHGPQYPDVLFVQAGGKHRMHLLASALRALDVNVDVIADIDVLNDETVLKKLVEGLGGNWDHIWKEGGPLKKEIEQQKLWLDSSEVVRQIQEILEKAPKSGMFPAGMCGSVKDILGRVSPWQAIKVAGKAAIPRGDATTNYERLQVLCNAIGLWIAPVGELEGFCRSEGNKGPRWVQNVLEKHDVRTAEELEDARTFIRQVWNRISP